VTETRTTTIPEHKLNRVVLLCFFISGVTALIYEVLWTRMIVKIIGNAPFAVSIILTVFMGGLGLGSLIAGGFIDRVNKPQTAVRIYGILELLIGLYALLLPVILSLVQPICAILYNQLYQSFAIYTFLTFVICLLVLITPVICMGATLPILCRFYVTRLSHIGTHSGRLYGVNTIGAAAGALLCGFWLINLLGVVGTLIVAVFLNGLIGFVCLLLAERISAGRTVESTSEQRLSGGGAQYTPDVERGGSYVLAVSLFIFAVSGFCSMSYEVIWTKLLGLLVAPTTYSFTIVLVSFILGLALGSLFFGWLADKTKDALGLLIFTQITGALCALAVSHFLGNSQLFFAKLICRFQHNFLLLNMSKAGALFVLMFVPTICFGAAFPLVARIYTRSIKSVGHSIGFAYAVNTAGAVSGSFCAGFILIPFFGKEKAIGLVVSFQLFVVLVSALLSLAKNKRMLLNRSVVTVAAVFGLFLCSRYPAWNRLLLSVGKYHRFEQSDVDPQGVGWLDSIIKGSDILAEYQLGELLYYGDGIGGFTTVLKYCDPFGNFTLTMANSGKTEASSRGDMDTQALAAHLPLVFHRAPKKVMVIGLASGITAGEILYYPIQRLDVLEINRQVVAASDFFLPWNNNVLEEPRTNVIIQDARAHLQLTNEKYDIIISEPSNPWMAGMATLFTRQFFELARKRLRQDGIFVQWIHTYQIDWRSLALIGRTFADVFPNHLLVATDPSGRSDDYLLVGLKSKGGLDIQNLRRNFHFTQRSKNINLPEARLFVRLILCDDFSSLFGPGPLNTDNRPRLEFSAPRVMHWNDPSVVNDIMLKSRLRNGTLKKIAAEVKSDIDSQIDFAVFALSVNKVFRNMVDLSKASTEQKERFFSLMEDYCADNPVDYLLVENEQLENRCLAVQIGSLESRIDGIPEKGEAYLYLGNLYNTVNEPDRAIAAYKKSLQYQPNNAPVYNNLGNFYIKQGDTERAFDCYRRAAEIRPSYALAYFNMALIYEHQSRIDKAIEYFRKTVKVKPDFAEAYNRLAAIFRKRGDIKQAISYYIKAVSADSGYVDAYIGLGSALLQEQRFDEAADYYKEGIQINPASVELHLNLAIALNYAGRPNEAVERLIHVIQVDPNLVEAYYNLAHIYQSQDRLDEAVKYYRKTLQLNEGFAEANINLGLAVHSQGKLAEAINCFNKALKSNPDDPKVLTKIAWILSAYPEPDIHNVEYAVILAERAAVLTGYNDPDVLETLSSCYASAKQFDKAESVLTAAMKLAADAGDTNLVKFLQTQLQTYKDLKNQK